MLIEQLLFLLKASYKGLYLDFTGIEKLPQSSLYIFLVVFSLCPPK